MSPTSSINALLRDRTTLITILLHCTVKPRRRLSLRPILRPNKLAYFPTHRLSPFHPRNDLIPSYKAYRVVQFDLDVAQFGPPTYGVGDYSEWDEKSVSSFIGALIIERDADGVHIGIRGSTRVARFGGRSQYAFSFEILPSFLLSSPLFNRI